MLFIIKLLANVLKVLNSEEAPTQMAAGFAFGALIGLLPLGMLATALGLFAFLININLGTMAIAVGVFKIVGFAVDPVANHLGFALLTKIPALHGFWTKLANMPLVPYSRFNNTIVMGSLVIGVLLLVPNYFLGKKLVHLYRTQFRDKVEQFKIMKILKASSVWKYYETYKGIRGQ